MNRRQMIGALGGAAAWPLAALGQQAERMRRIGIVMPFAKGDSDGEARVRAFKEELAKLGWTDGGNIQFDERWPADNMELVRSHAASLVASNPAITVASGGRIVPGLDAAHPLHSHGAAGRERPGRRRLGAKPGAAGRQRHWVH
jgi:putative ABC transport system substrate-binding protein